MIRYVRISVLITAVLLFPFSAYADRRAQNEFVHLLSGYHTMKANFEQQLINGKGVVVRKTSGKMAIKKPGKLRWETFKPDRQIIVANNRSIWIYDVDLQQALHRHPSKRKHYSAVYLLTEKVSRLPYYYSIQLVRSVKNKKTFRLFPRYHNDNVQAIEIIFNGKKVSRIVVLDGLGQRVHFDFKNVRLNTSISNNRFILQLPRSIDVISQ